VYVTGLVLNSVSVIATSQPQSSITIISSVDGNGNQVQNGISITSTSITFTVQATSGTNLIAGFQCSLDNGPFNNCNSNNQNEITFSNLESNQEHTIKIRAVDDQGIVESTSATFSWFVTQQSPSNNNNNITTTNEFDGHGGNTIATIGSTNGGHGSNGGADGKYLKR